MPQVDANQALQTVQDVIAWISGITGFSSLSIVLYGLAFGERAIKRIMHILTPVAIIAVIAWLWSSGLLMQGAHALGLA